MCAQSDNPMGGYAKSFMQPKRSLAEMHTIKCIEHSGRSKFITPSVGTKVEVCKIIAFHIPDVYAQYMSQTRSLQQENAATQLSQKLKNRLFSTNLCKTQIL